MTPRHRLQRAAAAAIATTAVALPAAAQETALPSLQNPPGITWRVIETPQVRVLAPAELAPEARRVAARLAQLQARLGTSLPATPPQWPLVLHNRRTESNGFVTLMPRRSEWYDVPPQGDALQGALDWHDLLAIHEFRHVQQFAKARRGLTRASSALLGETAWSFFSSWTLPRWYWEGDAVAIETALTPSGRGRIPAFDAELRALLVDRPPPSYWTMVHGSLGRFVPDVYQHGYTLVDRVRERFGASVWDEAVGRATARAWNPWGLSAALHRATGEGLTAMHHEAMQAAGARAKARAIAVPSTPAEPVDGTPRAWTNAEFPQWDGDSAVIVRRWGIDDLPMFVRYPLGGTVGTVVHVPGPSPLDVPHSVAAGRLAWIERRFDARWGMQTWSVVLVRDLRSGTVRQLGDTTRWTAVALAPDGARLAMIEAGRDGRAALVVADSAGRVLVRHVQPDGDALVTPRFTPDGASVLLARIRRGAGRRLERMDAATGVVTALTPFGAATVSSPATDGRYIYAHAPLDTRDHVVALEPATGTWRHVAVRAIGATAPVVSPDGRRLAFTDWTADGRRARWMPIDPATWREADVSGGEPARARALAEEEGGAVRLDTLPEVPMTERAWSPWRDGVRPYGFAVTLPPLGPDASARLLARDLLGVASASLGATYDQNERQGGVEATASWAAWVPIVDVAASVEGRRAGYPAVTVQGTAQPAGTYTWRESAARLGLRVPLNLTRSLYQTTITPQVSVEVREVAQSTLPPWFVSDAGRVAPVTWAVSGGRGYAWIRDIFPVWGQYATLLARHTPFGGDVTGGQWLARGVFFAPGPVRHHGLRLDVGREQQAPRESATAPPPYRFSALLPFARGYAARFVEGYTRVAADYAFPLAYPDRNLLQTVQLRRVRAAIFGDWTEGTRRVFVGTSAADAVPADVTARYRSAGLELWADTRWWHVPQDIPLGVRATWRFDGTERGSAALQGLVALAF